MRADSEVGIAVLLPDVLGTYSDAGNATVLAQRLRWRGIPSRVVEVTTSQRPPEGCELYVLGGGEDTAQQAAAAWLRRHPGLITTLADRAVTLAVCAGLQLLGRSTTDLAGLAHEGLGILDLTTRPASQRLVGESVSRCTLPGVGLLTGFHNHRGVSILGPGATPLARTDRWPANRPGHGEDRGAAGAGEEGALTPSAPARPGGLVPGVVATYLHGPVLARNPALADHLLARAVGRALPELDPGLLRDLPALRRTYLPRT